jgi:hypothetical protein
MPLLGRINTENFCEQNTPFRGLGGLNYAVTLLFDLVSSSKKFLNK